MPAIARNAQLGGRPACSGLTAWVSTSSCQASPAWHAPSCTAGHNSSNRADHISSWVYHRRGVAVPDSVPQQYRMRRAPAPLCEEACLAYEMLQDPGNLHCVPPPRFEIPPPFAIPNPPRGGTVTLTIVFYDVLPCSSFAGAPILFGHLVCRSCWSSRAMSKGDTNHHELPAKSGSNVSNLSTFEDGNERVVGGENISGGPADRQNHLVSSYFNFRRVFSLHFTQKSEKLLFSYSGGGAPQARRHDN